VAEKLEAWQVKDLTAIADALDLHAPSSGTKKDKASRILAFLEEPKVLNSKDLAAQVGGVTVWVSLWVWGQGGGGVLEQGCASRGTLGFDWSLL
jgi:hypothetical protein